MPKDTFSRRMRIMWSTQSNAALMSSIPSRVSFPWSAASKASDVTLRSAVSVEWQLRYADWCSGNRSLIRRWSVSCSLTTFSSTFEMNCKFEIGLYEITDLDLFRLDTKVKSVSCIQTKIREVEQNKFDLDVQGQQSKLGYWFCFYWDPSPRESWNQHRDLVLTIYTAGKKESYNIFTTLVLKVNRQSQVIYSSFSEIPDLRYVKIDTTFNYASYSQV